MRLKALTIACCIHFMFNSSASVVKVFSLKQMFPGPQQHHKYLKIYNININETMDLHKDLKRNHLLQRYLYSCVYIRTCIQGP